VLIVLVSRAFVESAKGLGIPFNDDYNALTQEGVAYPQFTIAQGERLDLSCFQPLLTYYTSSDPSLPPG